VKIAAPNNMSYKKRFSPCEQPRSGGRPGQAKAGELRR
jgi:hypothetical protein